MRTCALAALLLIAGPLLSQDYPLQAVPFTAVSFEDSFWLPRLEVNRVTSIPHAFAQCEETGRLKNFALAASVLAGEIPRGEFCSRYPFDDSDVFKIIEGASYTLQNHPDPGLDRYLDSVIALIARAQEPDGYLYSMLTMNDEDSWAPERWVNARRQASHELYNAGHLYEAAVAHYRATGKTSLLNLALRNADLLVTTFRRDGLRTVPGHQVTEMGLVGLYRVTGRREYLALAEFFLEERGRGNNAGDTYNQDHLPVAEQTEAVGHAVRAGYQYAAMADLAALSEHTEYLLALKRIWQDVAGGKLYVTGGVGSAGGIEGFSASYDLPNVSSYCETCAAIALVFWNHRMFLHTAEGKYVDLLERVLYNGFLVGVSIDGRRFFYVNPLESLAGVERSPWFVCACCPSNVVRFVPQIPSFAYATRAGHLYVNLFVKGTARVMMAGTPATITQDHRYPWEGSISIRVDLPGSREFSLHVRIPGWARSTPVPGGLYRYLGEAKEPVTIRVNDVSVSPPLMDGYAVLHRVWQPGDVVDLELPMQIRRTLAHEAVGDDRGKTALERGPIVYCLEGVDTQDGSVWPLVLADTIQLSSAFERELLGGVQVIRGEAAPVRRTLAGGVRIDAKQPFTAIPYYAWAHRGKHQMEVWVAHESSAAKPSPAPTIAYLSTVSSSAGTQLEAVTDQLTPKNLHDRSIPVFYFYPNRGTREWLQMDFGGVREVSRTTFYWFEDGYPRGCRVPTEWRLLSLLEGEWSEIATERITPGQDVSTFEFDPVKAESFRLELQLQPSFSCGIFEWEVE